MISSAMGCSPTGISGLGRIFVYGYSRVPSPPAIITTGISTCLRLSKSRPWAKMMSVMMPRLFRTGSASMQCSCKMLRALPRSDTETLSG